MHYPPTTDRRAYCLASGVCPLPFCNGVTVLSCVRLFCNCAIKAMMLLQWNIFLRRCAADVLTRKKPWCTSFLLQPVTTKKAMNILQFKVVAIIIPHILLPSPQQPRFSITYTFNWMPTQPIRLLWRKKVMGRLEIIVEQITIALGEINDESF